MRGQSTCLVFLAACGTVAGATDAPPTSDGGGGADACSGCPDTPRAIAPTNGAYTGSPLAPDLSLRPRFRWDALTGASEYQVQVDDSCPVTGFGDCAFDSPEAMATSTTTELTLAEPLPVSMIRPVGRRYFWRVRGCSDAGCGPWSATRYLLVGQQASDVNGDGLADLIASAVDNESTTGTAVTDEGTVSILFGRAPIPATMGDDDVTLASPVPVASGGFGRLVRAVGDVNGDGYGDILVASSAHGDPEADEGGAFLFYGREAWPAQLAQPDVVFDNPRDQAGALMGSSGGVGDLNGDGFADLAIGARYTAIGAATHVGEVYVWFGGDLAARVETWHARIDNPTTLAESYFGFVTAGDLDGDGYTDLVAASASTSNPELSEGNAWLFRGRPDWPATGVTPDATIDHPLDSPNGNFGVVLLTCDLNGDGLADLVSGDRESDAGLPGFGKAFAFFGRLTWGADVQTADVALDNPMAVDSQFGERTMGCRDLSADGVDDLLVSAVDEGTSTVPQSGAAYLFLGRAAWSDATGPTTAFASPTLRRSDHFGLPPIPFGDFDGDGFTDLAIGSRDGEPPAGTDTDNRGRVYLYRGRNGWPAALGSADAIVENPSAELSGAFGDAID